MAGWGPKVIGKGGGTNVPGDTAAQDNIASTIYNEISSVPTSVETTIITWNVPSGIFHLIRVEFGGENIAQYKLKFNTVTQARYATYFGNGLTGYWGFDTAGGVGIAVPTGTTVQVTVSHLRPDVADFWSRIQYVEIK